MKNIDYLKDKIILLPGNCTNEQDAQQACENQQVVMNLAASVKGHRVQQHASGHDAFLIT